MNWLIFVLSGLGVVMSVGANHCSYPQIQHHPDARLFGRIDWSLIGILGFGLIATTSTFPTITLGLTTGALLVTVLLMKRAYRIKLSCPFCIVVWLINILLFGAAVYNTIKA